MQRLRESDDSDGAGAFIVYEETTGRSSRGSIEAASVHKPDDIQQKTFPKLEDERRETRADVRPETHAECDVDFRAARWAN